jgi:hypothetical protein
LENEIEDKIIRTLAHLPLDYEEQKAFLKEERMKGVKWETAGVLVLLGKYPESGNSLDDYYFLLNKRSPNVQQPGDLCYPGGHPNHWFDLISSLFITPYLFSLKKSLGFKLNKSLNRESSPKIMYFLSTVLRESWEEVRLNPFKVDFLGALRCYRLEAMHRLVFPMVGIMKKKAKLKPNWEVEKILRIPLSSLFNLDKHARYRLRVKEEFKEMFDCDWIDNECYIHKEEGEPDEILWGATYKITMSFLKEAFDFELPDEDARPVIQGELYPIGS